jgi:nitrogen fixation/metabolism regulation signal transduction histidine kinase
MKIRSIVRPLTFLIILGMAALFIVNTDAQTDEDPWDAWVDEQTEAALKSAGEMDDAARAEKRTKIRAKFSALAADLKKVIPSPPQTQKTVSPKTVTVIEDTFNTESLWDAFDAFDNPDNIVHRNSTTRSMKIRNKGVQRMLREPLPKNVPQNVKALRNAYDKAYNERYTAIPEKVTHKLNGDIILAYNTPLDLKKVDAKYPRDKWIQMILDKGILTKGLPLTVFRNIRHIYCCGIHWWRLKSIQKSGIRGYSKFHAPMIGTLTKMLT